VPVPRTPPQHVITQHGSGGGPDFTQDRKKHVNIDIIGCQTKILCGNFKGKLSQTAIITEPITRKQ